MAKKNTYSASPVGIACDYPWINKADTKYNADGVYKTGLRCNLKEDAEAAAYKAKIDAEVDEAFEAETADLTAGEKKKWGKQYPYELEEDDDGNETGFIVFKFRQNAKLFTKDREEKNIRIAIYDSADNPVDIPVWGGAKIRVMAKPRNVKVQSAKKAGIRLDFLKVQVIAKSDSQGGSGGFGAVEGGYVPDDEETQSFDHNSGGKGAAESDY